MDRSDALPPSDTPRRRWVVRLGVMLASLVLALAGVEWYLARIWPVGGCVLQLDDELLFTTIPGASHVQFMSPSLTGRSVVVRVNQHGMLGPEPQDPPSRPRWMVFGDSFVMSENEPYSKSFCGRLAERWGGQIEVLCAGVTGYGPDQTLMRMQTLLPEYRPDGVLLVLCAYNDLGDPVRNNLMFLDENGDLQRRKAQVNTTETQWFEDNLAESHKLGLVRLWLNYKEIQGWANPQRPDATLIADYMRAHREDYEAHIAGDTLAHGLLRDVYEADVAIHPEWDSSRYKVRLMVAILREIRALCEVQGVPLRAVIVPGGVDLDPESLLRIDPVRYPTYQRDRLCTTIAGACQEAGVEALNLYNLFEERAPGTDLYVGPVDPHWNANGMDLGAEATAAYLAQQGLVEAR